MTNSEKWDNACAHAYYEDEEIGKQLRAICRESPWSYSTIESCYSIWPDIKVIKVACSLSTKINVLPTTLLGFAKEIADLYLFETMKRLEDENRKKYNIVRKKCSKARCRKCLFLEELFESTSKTDRDYWLMTELFVYLHGGLDVCKVEG